MFSNALKSFTSNISSNYTISPQPTSSSGPWKIYDAKKKSTGKPASVFVFDKKSLEPPAGAGFGGRSAASGLKRAHDEVLERLKKEASSLARLRHPSVLELVEPVEETRGGGLQFATETVTASLAGLLQEKDDQEKAGGVGGRRSRYVIEEADGQKRRRELEIDELEIQKGLLQIAKGLEFLHESAGLVHANLTPEAIFINAKVGNDILFVVSLVTDGCDSQTGKFQVLVSQHRLRTLRSPHRWYPYLSPKSSTTTHGCHGMSNSMLTTHRQTSS
jgi:SCY1-like protein 2